MTSAADVNWSLASEIDRLRTVIEAKDAEIERLQRALAYWMPGADLRLDGPTGERVENDANLLAGSSGPLDQACWGDEMIDRAERAEAEIARLKDKANFLLERGAMERSRAEQVERALAVTEAERRGAIEEMQRYRLLVAKAVEVLRPFSSATLTDDGQIIGLMREHFNAASAFIKEYGE